MASKRKRFVYKGWAYICDAGVVVTKVVDAHVDPPPVEVREVLPPCRHEDAQHISDKDKWCSGCGAYGALWVPTNKWKWNKPRRA